MSRHAVVAAIILASALLAACGSGAPPVGGAVAPPALPAAHPDLRPSAVAPDAGSTSQLLFETDIGTYSVYLFALPKMTYKGRISGFKEPLGDCADTRGNVWVANYLKHELLEYSHAGKLIGKIERAGLEPWSCAVNPVSGAIAISDSNVGASKPGEMLIYANPSAKPVIVSNPVQFYYFYSGYDTSGNLWEDGTDVAGHSIVSKCSMTTCTTIDLSGGSIFSAGAVVWDKSNHTWIVFDQYCHEAPVYCSYPISGKGAIGMPTPYLSNAGGQLCDLIQATMAYIGKRPVVVGADNEYPCTSYKNGTVNTWAYPTGGAPATFNEGNVIYPFGAAVSTQ